VMFFEFEATVDVQQQIHLSSSEFSVSGTLDLNGNATEGPAEESRLSGSEQAPRPSASLSTESRNANQPPEPSETSKMPWSFNHGRVCGHVSLSQPIKGG